MRGRVGLLRGVPLTLVTRALKRRPEVVPLKYYHAWVAQWRQHRSSKAEFNNGGSSPSPGTKL